MTAMMTKADIALFNKGMAMLITTTNEDLVRAFANEYVDGYLERAVAEGVNVQDCEAMLLRVLPYVQEILEQRRLQRLEREPR